MIFKFILEVAALAADPITWKSDHLVWAEQWPLTAEKLHAAEDLIMGQQAARHTEPSNSPWNTPIFVIKKKSGKWRLLQNLRAIKATMEDMGALQPGLPSPVAVPFQYDVIVTDLQDCFFTIPWLFRIVKGLLSVSLQLILNSSMEGFNGRFCLRE